MVKVVIPGRLPGLNELLGSANRHWAVGARLKKEAMREVEICFMAAKTKPIKGRAKIKISCFEPNARRDADNVQSGANKIILDSMQEIGIIKGDGRKYIDLEFAPVGVDRENPRIEVEIWQMGEADNFGENG